MTRLPNMSPAAEDAPAEAPPDDAVAAGENVAAPAPPAPASPPEETAPQPFIPGVHRDPSVAEIHDEQAVADPLSETGSLPKAALFLGAAATVALAGWQGMQTAGTHGIPVACLFAVGLMALATVIAVAAGWLVCKLFGDACGSAGSLLLRFSAAAVVQLPICTGIAWAVPDRLTAVMVSVPVLFFTVMWVAGFDFLRALVFNGLTWTVAFVIGTFFFMSAGNPAA